MSTPPKSSEGNLWDLLCPNGAYLKKKSTSLPKRPRRSLTFKKIRRGNPLYAYTDSIRGTTSFIVYQPSVDRFLVFDLRDSVLVHEGAFPVSKVSRTASGAIESSLYQAVTDAELPAELAIELSEIFAWQISFFSSATWR